MKETAKSILDCYIRAIWRQTSVRAALNIVLSKGKQNDDHGCSVRLNANFSYLRLQYFPTLKLPLVFDSLPRRVENDGHLFAL